MNFLDHYNDPFVERLFEEGVAYLSARVQTRLDRECAEFAQQALGRVCQLFMVTTPAISSFAFHPDLDSPEAFRGSTLPRGSLISARLPGRRLSFTFSTARDVTLPGLRKLHAALEAKVAEFDGIIKIGRTQMRRRHAFQRLCDAV